MLTTVRRALVLEPHPDDLAIGCAGLVQRLAEQGAEIHSLLLSTVPSTYSKIYDASGKYREYAGDDRMREWAQVDQILGLHGRTIAFGSEWHHRLDALPTAELIGTIEKCVSALGPDLVLVPAPSYNQDHRAVFGAFQAVMRPHFYKGAALTYETTMERSFEPNLIVPLTTQHIRGKLEACAAFETQLGSSEHLFSLETIELSARYRGRLVYTDAAEAFQLLRGTFG